jgi:hypothetical protein
MASYGTRHRWCCLACGIARVALGLLLGRQRGLAFGILGFQLSFELDLFRRLACCSFDSSAIGFRRGLCR